MIGCNENLKKKKKMEKKFIKKRKKNNEDRPLEKIFDVSFFP